MGDELNPFIEFGVDPDGHLVIKGFDRELDPPGPAIDCMIDALESMVRQAGAHIPEWQVVRVFNAVIDEICVLEKQRGFQGTDDQRARLCRVRCALETDVYLEDLP